MRDSKLASIATRLVETASEIERSLGMAVSSRGELLRKTRTKILTAQKGVPTELLGMAGRGYREHIELNLAHSIVAAAIKSIDFEVDPIPSLYGSFCTTRFTAKAYVLTQAELTALVDEAIEIGRRS